MSEIIKTEAVVLSKINYGDTSSIVAFYTKGYGTLSAIVKGGRSPKSKIGLIADPLNYLQLVLYKKDTRELQIISSADIIDSFSRIKEDFEKVKYSYAVLELLKKLMPEHEANEKLFKGVIRILTLMNTSKQDAIVLFGRFFMFFLSEIGFAVQIGKCAVCGRTNIENEELSYNFGMGILCNDCKKEHMESFAVDSELFAYLTCLKTGKPLIKTNLSIAEKAIAFMGKYLKYHVPDFKGIQSLELLK
jgi:DNA repair protein RecO (recombination protein O)